MIGARLIIGKFTIQHFCPFLTHKCFRWIFIVKKRSCINATPNTNSKCWSSICQVEVLIRTSISVCVCFWKCKLSVRKKFWQVVFSLLLYFMCVWGIELLRYILYWKITNALQPCGQLHFSFIKVNPRYLSAIKHYK